MESGEAGAMILGLAIGFLGVYAYLNKETLFPSMFPSGA